MPNALWLEIKNLKKIQKNLEDVVKKASDGSLVARAALVIERQVKINASGRPGPKVRTGRLRASINANIISKERAIVGTNVNYAPPVEFGTGPHEIRPKTAKALHFFIGGDEVFAKSVNHPGSKAYPFFRPAIEQTKDKVGDVMVTFGKELGAEFSK